MNHGLDHVLVYDSESLVWVYLINELRIVFLVRLQLNWKVPQIEFQAHHVLCLVHIEYFQHLLSNMQLIILRWIYSGHTWFIGHKCILRGNFARRLAICQLVWLNAGWAVLVWLARIAGSLALLAELAAELGQNIDVFLSHLAVSSHRLLAQILINQVHVEWQVYRTVQIGSLVVKIKLFYLWLTTSLLWFQVRSLRLLLSF